MMAVDDETRSWEWMAKVILAVEDISKKHVL